MHVLDEILSEGDEEQDAENPAEQRAQEYFKKVDGDFGMGLLQDVECRQSEYGSRDDHSGTRAYRLDDNVLTKRIVLFKGA